MALEYQLHIHASADPTVVLKAAFTNVFPEERDVPGLVSTGAQRAFNIRVALVEETYGIVVDTTLDFRLDKFDRERGLLATISLVGAVLHQQSGDAVLLFNGETPRLLRRRGVLYLQTDTRLWTSSRLAALSLAHRFVELPTM